MKNFTYRYTILIIILVFSLSGCSLDSENSFDPGTGQGGSLARFTILDNYLYIVDDTSLKIVDISDPLNPHLLSTTLLGRGIETIFPYGGYLFIGSTDGMYIYSVEQPDNPTFVSVFSHLTACDPVVVQGDYAYVTLRDGVDCWQSINQLEVVNVSNIFNPRLERTVPMRNPHGLGVDERILFVTEGTFGLKQFQLDNPTNPVELRFIDTLKAFDVIMNNGLLMVVGQDGLFQFGYGQDGSMVLLSAIKRQ